MSKGRVYFLPFLVRSEYFNYICAVRRECSFGDVIPSGMYWRWRAEKQHSATQVQEYQMDEQETLENILNATKTQSVTFGTKMP